VKRSGAKYFVFTSKHHDGYAMWPSNHSWNWNSVEVGPHRDIVGDLATAMRAEGIRFGLYHSLRSWFHPLFLRDEANGWKTTQFVDEVVLPQMKEIVNTYEPEMIWSDGDGEAGDEYWKSREFLAWLYNDSPVKDNVAVNDRWGSGAMCKHGDYWTCADYFSPGMLVKKKWENIQNIDAFAWGYRRDAELADIRTIEWILHELAKTVSCGGNLLLNVGPTHYGKITPIYEERLTQIGEWLAPNGEAIFDSKPWVYQNDSLTQNVWYTSKVRSDKGMDSNRLYNPQNKENTIVYAFFFHWPDDNQLKLGAPTVNAQTKVSLLGYSGTVTAKQLQPNGLIIDLNSVQWTRLPSRLAWVLKLEYLESDTRVPPIYEPN